MSPTKSTQVCWQKTESRNARATTPSLLHHDLSTLRHKRGNRDPLHWYRHAGGPVPPPNLAAADPSTSGAGSNVWRHLAAEERTRITEITLSRQNRCHCWLYDRGGRSVIGLLVTSIRTKFYFSKCLGREVPWRLPYGRSLQPHEGLSYALVWLSWFAAIWPKVVGADSIAIRWIPSKSRRKCKSYSPS